MKKILIITTYILGFSWTIYGQADCPPNSNPITTENYCEDGKGISTDPNDPENCQIELR